MFVFDILDVSKDPPPHPCVKNHCSKYIYLQKVIKMDSRNIYEMEEFFLLAIQNNTSPVSFKVQKISFLRAPRKLPETYRVSLKKYGAFGGL